MQNKNRYIIPIQLNTFFNELFDLKLLTNFDIYSVILAYKAASKSKDNKDIIVNTNIISTMLVTRDLNTDSKVQGVNRDLMIDGIPTRVHYCVSKIIVNINDELSPVGITSNDINYYCAISDEFIDLYREVYEEAKTYPQRYM